VVRPGDSVTISATGLMHFGPAPIDRVAPKGVGRRCLAPVAGSQWPAPTLSCWSLIARIGSSPPFEVGTGTTVRVREAGELALGVNDDHLVDDAGVWTVVVNVRPVASSPSTTPAAGATNATSNSSSVPVVAVIALVALVGLVAILAVMTARSRRRRASVPAVVGAEPVEPTAGSAHAVPPFDRDTAKGNIFDVEFADRESLAVAYGYFPEGTVVQCRVMHNSATAATGEFTTNGGATTQHSVAVPLSTAVTSFEGVKVQFSWTIGDLLEYSVTRDPAVPSKIRSAESGE
jgi:hypothetical protein